eukprot:4630645-Amphidinium_carterae.1
MVLNIWFSWDEAALIAKWGSAQVLCADVASTWADFDGLAAGSRLAKEGAWLEERVHSAFQFGDLCVKCSEAVENLEHIVYHCPHWNKERCESGLPATAQSPAWAPEALCPRMNLLWFCGRMWTRSGLRDDTGECVWLPFLPSVLNFWAWCVPWKNAVLAGLSATAKGGRREQALQC